MLFLYFKIACLEYNNKLAIHKSLSNTKNGHGNLAILQQKDKFEIDWQLLGSLLLRVKIPMTVGSRIHKYFFI